MRPRELPISNGTTRRSEETMTDTFRARADLLGTRRGGFGFHSKPALEESPAALRQVAQAVARAKEGDREAVRFLYLQYADNVYGYVRSIVRDDFEAEDVTQQVFAKLMTVDRQVPGARRLVLGLDHAGRPQRRGRPPPAPPRDPVRGGPRARARRGGRCVPQPFDDAARRARRAAGGAARGDRPAPPRRAQPGRDRRPPRPDRALDPRPAPPRARRAAHGPRRDAVRPDRRPEGRLRDVRDRALPSPRSRSPAWTRPTPSCSRSCSRSSRAWPAPAPSRMGHELEAFEQEFATYCGSDHAVGVSNGTDAISLALRALEIGPGDEVIVPDELVHRHRRGRELDGRHAAPGRRRPGDAPDHARGRRGRDRPAHPRRDPRPPDGLDGRHPRDRRGRARRRHPRDRGHGPGARRVGARAAASARWATSAASPSTRPRTSARGATAARSSRNDEALAHRVRLLRSHGEGPRYHHRIVGTTARLDALQAALLRVKLRHLDARNDDRRRLGSGAARRSRGPRPWSFRRRPSRAPTTSTTCSSCARRSATRCARTCDDARRLERRALPVPDPPDRGLRGPRVRRRQPAGRRAAWPRRSARSRCSRRCRTRRSSRSWRRSRASRHRSDQDAPHAQIRPIPASSRSNVAVVGYGYWGPNLVRNVIERPGVPARRPVRARPDARRGRSRPRRRARWCGTTWTRCWRCRRSTP